MEGYPQDPMTNWLSTIQSEKKVDHMMHRCEVDEEQAPHGEWS